MGYLVYNTCPKLLNNIKNFYQVQKLSEKIYSGFEADKKNFREGVDLLSLQNPIESDRIKIR